MNNFWNLDELEQIHIELTNACNAACPMCVRFYNNSPNVRPDLEINQITYEKFVKYFPPKIIEKCNLIFFCGVHGDPCVARDTYEICEYISQVGPNTAVRIHTNGGMRKPDWWEKMGKLFSNFSNRKNNLWEITFSIDGLEDTNHVYRRNVVWKSLMENVSAYINAGGSASWDYLIFKHNEHQLAEAKEFAEKMKFRTFVPKKALGVDDGISLTKMPVLDKNGNLEYVIEAPENPKNRNLEKPEGTLPIRFYPFNLNDYRKIKGTSILKEKYRQQVENVYEERILNEDNSKFNNCEIKCKSKTLSGGKEIFVDNFGRVMPCCYIGTHLNGLYNDFRSMQLHKHMNDYGWDNFSLDKHSLEEILNNHHLDRVFADSWKIPKVEDGRLSYCADTCGKISSIDKIFSHDDNPNKFIRNV
jgi:MoaA/NifB/PqqE/SkfB family radical SAM enzyme